MTEYLHLAKLVGGFPANLQKNSMTILTFRLNISYWKLHKTHISVRTPSTFLPEFFLWKSFTICNQSIIWSSCIFQFFIIFIQFLLRLWHKSWERIGELFPEIMKNYHSHLRKRKNYFSILRAKNMVCFIIPKIISSMCK